MGSLKACTGVGAPPLVDLQPGNLAYMIYTSGSTGRPKGAANSHEGLHNRLAWMQDAYRLGGDDVVLQKTPFGFDVSVWEFFWPLITGARLVLAAPGAHRDPAQLVETIRSQGVTTLHFVPSMLQAFVEHVASSSAKHDAVLGPNPCPSLRRIICSGEALPAALRDRVARLWPDVQLENLYGPTEASIDVTRWACAGDGSAEVPIGRPIWNTRVYVLDGALEPVPAGVVGELYIAGTGWRGAISTAPGLRRSGSSPIRMVLRRAAGCTAPGTWRAGGQCGGGAAGVLEFVGRADAQVKLRGFRIEPGEIEAVLLRQQGVSQAVVIVRDDGSGGKRLIGYVVAAAAAAGTALDTGSLRASLARQLPDYMVPQAIMALDALPLTANGKLDRRALPEPELGSAQAQRAPRNPQEAILCELFAAVLGRPAVGVDDNFFELGGHSLLATRLISRIRAVLNVEVAIRSLFEAPSVALLAPKLAGEAEALRAPLVALPRPADIPLSYAQRRLWFLERLEGASGTYLIPMAVRLTGALDRDALQAALGDLVERHESLRTIVPDRLGVPRQVVLEPSQARPALQIEAVDEAGLTETGLAAALTAAASRGFELSRETPLRAHLFELAADEAGQDQQVLLILLHHIAGDGWSLGPLWRDLAALYRARHDGVPAALSPLPVQYADYTLWQRAVLGEESDPASAIARQLSFWKTALDGLPEQIELPTDRPRPAVSSHRGGHLPLVIPAGLHGQLAGLAQRSGASLFMVLQAALTGLLSRLGGGTDIAIGSPIAGRTDAALDELIGFFVNTLVLRTDLSGQPSFDELIGRVRSANLSAYAHQDLPFERLVEVLNPARSLSRHPLFQVMLAFETQTPGAGPLDLAGLTG